MTPFEISIMLHYYTRVDDFRCGDFSAQAAGDALTSFLDLGLLREVPYTEGGRAADYGITDRGRAYVEALKAVPLPIQKWVMPS